MADDQIRYDILAQEALRGVMRKVLAEVARTGLPGNHHFFITFLTNAPGVRISTRLRERYPEQMTIVLQFQYWDLKVTETTPGEYAIAGALDAAVISDVLGWFAAKEAQVTAVNTRRRTLEDVYLALTAGEKTKVSR